MKEPIKKDGKEIKRRCKPKSTICDYSKLGSTKKEVVLNPGLFSIPKLNQGKKDYGMRKFVIFYFEDLKEYEKINRFKALHFLI